MATRLIILLVLLGTSEVVFAATYSVDTTRKSVYYNAFLSGTLIGGNDLGNTLSFQTIHGLRNNRFSYGISVGFDSYIRSVVGNNNGILVNWKSVPLAAMLSYDLFHVGKNTVLLSGVAGYSKIWTKNSQEFGLFFENKGGIMVHPSIGYRIPSANHNLYINAGYKWQINHYRYNYRFSGTPPAFWPSVIETMERLTLAIGFGWN